MNIESDKLKNVQLIGDIIPIQWYKAITRKGSEKSDTVAIPILANIIHWYTPRLERSKKTGESTGWLQRFNADKLQMGYAQLSKLFGFSKGQCKDAIDNLVRLGLVTREFRNLETETGLLITNVMFIEPCVDEVLRITNDFRSSDFSEEVVRKKVGISSDFSEVMVGKKGGISSDFSETTPYSCIRNDYLTTTTTTTTITHAEPLPAFPEAVSSQEDKPKAVVVVVSFDSLFKKAGIQLTSALQSLVKATASLKGQIFVESNVRYAISTNKDKRSFRAYLEQCFRNDWGTSWYQEVQEIAEKKKALSIASDTINNAKRIKHVTEDRVIQNNNDKVKVYLSGITDDQVSHIKSEFVAKVINSIDNSCKIKIRNGLTTLSLSERRQEFNARGFDSRLIKPAFERFISREYLEKEVNTA